MLSIGTDITSISRIEKSFSRENFKDFVYGEKEQKLFITDKVKYSSLAANFAAKEAFAKALGTGVRGFSLNEVEILRNEQGMPYFCFSGKALEIVTQNNYTAQVSLSHEGDNALAFVILHKIDNNLTK